MKHFNIMIFLVLGLFLTEKPYAQDIIGGKDVELGKYPFMMGVIEANNFDLRSAMNCGASLISPNWAITAAHCVDNLRPEEVHVLAQTVDLSSPKGNSNRVKIKRIVIHPNYEKKLIFKNGQVQRITLVNDIALIELESKVNAPHVNLPLFNDDSYNLHGLPCQIMGWGKNEPQKGGVAEKLQEAGVFVIDRDVCKTYDLFGEYVTDNMICAGQTEPGKAKGGAKGDSGGPLVILENKGWKQIGVMSWGLGYTRYEAPGVYQKVSSHLEWIKNTAELVTSNHQIPDDHFMIKTHKDHSEIISSIAIEQGAQYDLSGRLISRFGPTAANEALFVQRNSNIPTVLYLWSEGKSWSSVLR